MWIGLSLVVHNTATKIKPVCRPELVESTYLLYQATKNPFYLHVGRDIIHSLNNHTRCSRGFFRVSDPYWIRIQLGQWIWIQEGKNDPQKKEFHVLECWMFSFEMKPSFVTWTAFMEA
jgi:hypothetical protein